MTQSLVNIKLHGILGETLRNTWNLAVKSVSESIHAIEILSGRKLFKTLLEFDKKNIKYRVLINGRDFIYDKETGLNSIEGVQKSELTIPVKNLKTIDIVPIIEGADSDFGSIIMGALLIAASFIPGIGQTIQIAMIVGGLGLVAAGVINLLSSPPKFEDFRDIQTGSGAKSYLFNGPQNTTQEGGPVPLGYGRLLIGSHVIATSYEVTDQNASNTLTT